MTLLADQMAERRERILEAAREVIGEHGFEALTMRELAQASGVTVPTIYNLIGNKHRVLFAAVEEQTERWAQGIERTSGDVLAIIEANGRELLSRPAYYRSLVHLMSRSVDVTPAQRSVTRAVRNHLRVAVGELAEEGGLDSWVDLDALTWQLHTNLVAICQSWADGETPDDQLTARVLYGATLLLSAAASPEMRETYTKIARAQQAAGASPSRPLGDARVPDLTVLRKPE